MKNSYLIWSLSVPFACAIAATVAAEESRATAKPEVAVIESLMPGTTVRAVNKTPIEGIFEIVNEDGNIFYSDASGRIGLFGNLVDLTTRRSITTERLGEVRRVDFGSLPLELAIKRVHGNGARQLAVFSDPDCPYCQQLERTLVSLRDVTIYLFPFPVEELHPGATKRAEQIWCSADRAQAWEAWLLRSESPPPAPACETPIREIQALAGKLMISATPGLVFASGRNVPGAIGDEEIERYLSEPALAPAADSTAGSGG